MMISILIAYWVLIICFGQALIILCALYACWKGISEAARNMSHSNFSVRVLVMEIMKAMGQGEW